ALSTIASSYPWCALPEKVCGSLVPGARGRADLDQVSWRLGFERFLRSAVSAAQDRPGQLFQPVAVGKLQVAPVDLDQAIALEALEHPADGLRRQPQVVGDVGARHRQLEAVGREAACGEAPRQADQERGH